MDAAACGPRRRWSSHPRAVSMEVQGDWPRQATWASACVDSVISTPWPPASKAPQLNSTRVYASCGIALQDSRPMTQMPLGVTAYFASPCGVIGGGIFFSATLSTAAATNRCLANTDPTPFILAGCLQVAQQNLPV